jgi:hypothetical protein
MKVICWNIRQNTGKNIQPELIRSSLAKVVEPGEPWILAVLENKGDGIAVEDALKGALQTLVKPGTVPATKIVSAGGGRHTSENVVLIAGNCDIANAQAYHGWKDSFRKKTQSEHDEYSSAKLESPHMARFRSSTQDVAQASLKRATPWDADKCRSPVIVDCMADGQTYKFGFVHSPGPRESPAYSQGDESYAKIYFTEIMEGLKEQDLSCLMGDFNLYGSEPKGSLGKMVEITKDLGGTTFARIAATLGDSRLDRGYASPRFCNNSSAELVDGSPAVSDHAGVCITLREERAAPVSVDEPEDSDVGAAPQNKRPKKDPEAT